MKHSFMPLSATMFAVSFFCGAYAADMPSGTYRKTCAVQSFRDSVLAAACQPENNPNFRVSQLDIRSCRPDPDVFNRDGGLQCFARQGFGEGRAVPRGSYIGTCKDVIVSAGRATISAQCKDSGGRYRNTQLSTIGCPVGAALDNDNGSLVCRR